jgi:predicted acyl esterase
MARPDVQITAPPEGIAFDQDIEVHVRDGVILRVDVQRPRTPGRYPAILERPAVRQGGHARGRPQRQATRTGSTDPLVGFERPANRLPVSAMPYRSNRVRKKDVNNG